MAEQERESGNLNASGENIILNVEGCGTVGVQIVGTFVGTVSFYVSSTGDTADWVAVNMSPPNSSTQITQATAVGLWAGSVAGYRFFKAQMTAYTSGRASVVIAAVATGGGTSTGGSSGGGGGTEYTEGDVDSSIAGTAFMWEDTSNTLRAVSEVKPLPVAIITGAGSGGTALTDDAAFTPAVSSYTPIGGIYRSSLDAVDDNDGGAAAMTINRALHSHLVGPTGTAVPQGSGNATGALRVELPTNGTGVIATVTAVTAITNALPAGTNAIGKLAANSGVDIGDVDVTSSALPTGAATSAKQDTEITSLQLIDDTVVTLGTTTYTEGTTKANVIGAVRRDANTTLADTTNEIAPLQVDASGSLKVAIISGAGSGGTSIADDAAFTVAVTSLTPVGGTYKASLDAVDDGDAGAFAMTINRAIHSHLVGPTGTAVPQGSGTATGALRVELPTNGTGVIATVGTLTNALPAGTNNIGDVDVLTLGGQSPAYGSGANGATVLRVALATDSPGIITEVAHDAVDAGDPIKMGGYASAAAPTSVSADADRVNAWFLRNGAQATVITAAGALIGGDASNGLDVDVTRVPTDPFGANADSASATGSISAKLKFIASTGIPITGTVTVGSHAVTNAGTFVVQESGAALTALQLADDVVATLGTATYSEGSTKATVIGAVRRDADTTLVDTTNEIAPLQVNAGGQLKTVVVGTVTVGSHAVTNTGTFATQVDGAALTSLQLIDDPVATLGTTTYTEAATKGMIIGAVRRDADTTLVDTTNEVAPLQVNAGGQLKTAVINTVTVASHAVTNAGVFAVQAVDAGDVAHDGVDSGNPIKVGAMARSTEPAAVASADRVNLIADLVGKLIVLPYSNPENFVSGAITSAMTGTTSTSCVAAPASGLRNYITHIVVSNGSTTVPTDILIQDGSGGTTLYVIPAPAGTGTGTGASGGSYTLPTPLRQPTTATAIFVANVTTGSSTKVSMSGYKGA